MNNVLFDEDESMIVVAETSKQALGLATSSWFFREGKYKESIVQVAHYGD